ncbi:MAG TPA: hypothetical protein VN809_08625 [Telmatospirillum sp.]|nr:hypothetical protein [Telmatospirillum sp.]
MVKVVGMDHLAIRVGDFELGARKEVDHLDHSIRNCRFGKPRAIGERLPSRGRQRRE